MKNVKIMVSINNNIIIDNVNYIYVKKSRRELISSAEVHLATKYVYEGEWKNMSDLVNIADPIEIYSGYDDALNLEFSGYVSNIKKGFPLVLSCEDEMFQLKREDVKPKSWKETTLKKVLEYIAGTGKVSGDVPGISLKPFYIKGKLSKLKVLETLKSQYGIGIYFRNGKLYGGFPYQDSSTQGKSAIYDLGYNTIDESTSLNYRRKEDVRIKIKVVSIMSDNTKYEAQIGDLDGELRTIHLYNIGKADIKKRAEEELKKWKFTGYRGKIVAFGEPYCEHGWMADIRDDEDQVRNSKYFVESTTLQGGVDRGLRRTVELGRRGE